MRSGVKYKESRRSFVKNSILLTLGSYFLSSCKRRMNTIFLKLTGTNHILGHKLRFPDFPNISETMEIPVLIIGGGIAGLTAGYTLNKRGGKDFLIVELEAETGGNAKSGENKYSKYPLGAHYLPLPNASNVELIDFLFDVGVIIGRDENDNPIFDEEQLSFAPQERLFIKNYWQEGIVPQYGSSDADQQELTRFLHKMEEFQALKDQNGHYIFNIPMCYSSPEKFDLGLDQITMEEWLRKEGYTSSYLHEYLNYCCRDDYGTGIKYTAAFAVIHYFAARKHDFKKYEDAVLTWQEGNGRLAKLLAESFENQILKQHMVYKITVNESNVEVLLFDAQRKVSKKIIAEKVINCCPQYINKYLLPQRGKNFQLLQYAPWIVATVVLHKFPFADGANLAWENIIFGAKGLGYVYAQHQSLGQFTSPFVISYYHSLDGTDLNEQRRKLYNQTDEQWKEFIIKDLSIAHFGIEDEIISIEIFRHGHGMVSPIPGYLSSEYRKQLTLPIANKIFFAHSDLSGVSIFEEAFYQGRGAVDDMLDNWEA